jgi:hypothetical protein
MSIESPVGTLDIKNATLRVGKLEVSNIQGIDTALNVTRSNSILLYDDQASATTFNGFTSTSGVRNTASGYLDVAGGHVYWGQKLPNAWTMEFEMDIRSGTNSGPIYANVFSSTNTGGDGYSFTFNDSNDKITLMYDGAVLTETSVPGLFTTSENWQKVVINYERGMITVSLGGSRAFYYNDIEREKPYTTGEYVNVSSSSTDGRKIRGFKVTNGDKWTYSGESNITYTHGSLGIGVVDPTATLDVAGTVNATAFVGDGTLLSNVVNDTDLQSNVTTLRDEMASNTVTLRGDLQSNVTTLRDEMASNTTTLRGDLQSNVTTLRGEMTSNTTTLRGDLQSNVTILRDEMASNTTTLRGDLQSNVTTLRDEMASNTTTLRGDLQSNVTTLRDEMASNTVTLRSDLQSNVTTLREDIQSNVTTLRGEMASNTTTLRGDLQSNVTTLRGEMASNTATLRGDLQSNVTTLRGEMASNTVTLRGDLQSNVTTLRGEMASNTVTLRGDLQSNVTTLRGEMASNTSTLRGDLQSNVTTLRGEMASNTTTLRGDLQSNVTILKDTAITFQGKKTFQDDVILESNLRIQGDILVANTINMTVSDPILELGSNNQNTGDLGLVMTRHGTSNSNVAVFFDESADVLKLGYTLNGANDSTLELDSNALAVNIQGALTAASLSGDGSGLTSLNAGNIGSGTLHKDRLPTTLNNMTIEDAGSATLTLHDSSGDNQSRTTYLTDSYAWSTGIHGGEDGKFKITNNSSFGTKDYIVIKTDGSVGIGTDTPAYKLDVHGTSNVGALTATSGTFSGEVITGNTLKVGTNTNNETAKTIYFGGTYGDNAYDHCVIERRVYTTGTEKQELLLFSGNDGETSSGPDRIRLKGAQILFDTLNSSTDRTTENTKMIIKAGGNVGIGTTSPSSKLHVFGGALSADTDLATFHYTNGNQSYLKIRQVNHTPANANWNGWSTRIQQVTDVTDQSYIEFNPVGGTYATAFGRGGNEYMRINDGGNVGIGTTSPSTLLHIVDSDVNSTTELLRLEKSNTNGDINDASIGYIGMYLQDANTGGGEVARISYGHAGDDIQGSGIGQTAEGKGKLGFWTSDTGSADAVPVERMTINHKGNVGIGTDSPEEKLHLASDDANPLFLKMVGNTSNRAGIILSEHATDNNVIMEYDGTGSGAENYFSIYSSVSGWASKGSGLNFVPSNGNVGIGTTSPGYKLDVNGTVNTGALTATTGAFSDDLEVTGTLSTKSDVSLGVMSGHETEGTLKFSRADGTDRVHNIKVYNSSTQASNYMKFQIHAGGASAGALTDNVLYLRGDGNVGIGTSSPSYKLDVNGTLHAGDSYFDNVYIGGSTSRGLKAVTGNYGTVQTTGTGASSWQGYSIDGNYVLMAQSNKVGLYNDINNEWMLLCTQNAGSALYYNGSEKLATTSDGVSLTGGLTATTGAFSGALTATSMAFSDNLTITGAATKYPPGNMTNYTTTLNGGAYIVSDSSHYSTSYRSWEAFDGNRDSAATAWISANNTYLGSYTGTRVLFTGAPAGEWLKIQFPHPIAISHTDIYCRGTDTTRGPKDGYIYGSTNGTTWTQLIQFSGLTYVTNTPTRVDLNQTNAYSYYAIVTTAIAFATSTWVGIGEWELFSHDATFSGDITAAAATFSGNVGIGTNDPNTKLHVKGGNIKIENNGSDSIDNKIIFAETGYNDRFFIGTDLANSGAGDQHLRFGFTTAGDSGITNSNVIMNISGSGDVGIGTSSPAYTLDVHGTSNVGALTVTSVSGDGSGLTSLNASNISSGTIADSTGGVKAIYFTNTEQSGYYTDKSGILAFDENFYPDTEYGTGTYDPKPTFVGGNGGGLLIKNEDGWGAIFTSQNTRWAKGYWDTLAVTNTVTASTFSGSGSGLTSLNADNLGSGTVPSARLSLTASDIPSLDADKITTGTIDSARLSLVASDIPSLDASKITSGTLGRPISTTTGVFTSDGNVVLVGPSGGGQVGLTINDGDGNANVTFNHASRIPDRNGSSGRIDCGVDSTTGYMRLRVKDNVTDGTSTGNLPDCVRIEEGYVRAYSDFYAGGNVGIGTTSPSAKLHINTGATEGAVFAKYETTGNGYGGIEFRGTRGSGSNGSTVGQIQSYWQNSARGGIIFNDGGDISILPTRNVGIGTASPSYNLHVSGTSQFEAEMRWSLGTRTSHAGYSTNKDWYIRSGETAGKVILQDGGGNVGIGTASPGYKLVVAGDIYATGDIIGANGNFGTGGIVRCAKIGRPSNNNAGFQFAEVYSVPLIYPAKYSSGTISAIDNQMWFGFSNYRFNAGYFQTLYRNAEATFSDDRIKTGESLITNATETLLKLKPQTYDKHTFTYDEITDEEYSNVNADGLIYDKTMETWVDRSEYKRNTLATKETHPWIRRTLSKDTRKEAGLIAQDIWYDVPELKYIVNIADDASPAEEKPVSETDDIQQDPDYDAAGWGTTEASVSYTDLISYLIKSIQELNERIKVLENPTN